MKKKIINLTFVLIMVSLLLTISSCSNEFAKYYKAFDINYSELNLTHTFDSVRLTNYECDELPAERDRDFDCVINPVEISSTKISGHYKIIEEESNSVKIRYDSVNDILSTNNENYLNLINDKVALKEDLTNEYDLILKSLDAKSFYDSIDAIYEQMFEKRLSYAYEVIGAKLIDYKSSNNLQQALVFSYHEENSTHRLMFKTKEVESWEKERGITETEVTGALIKIKEPVTTNIDVKVQYKGSIYDFTIERKINSFYARFSHVSREKFEYNDKNTVHVPYLLESMQEDIEVEIKDSELNMSLPKKNYTRFTYNEDGLDRDYRYNIIDTYFKFYHFTEDYNLPYRDLYGYSPMLSGCLRDQNFNDKHGLFIVFDNDTYYRFDELFIPEEIELIPVIGIGFFRDFRPNDSKPIIEIANSLKYFSDSKTFRSSIIDYDFLSDYFTLSIRASEWNNKLYNE